MRTLFTDRMAIMSDAVVTWMKSQWVLSFHIISSHIINSHRVVRVTVQNASIIAVSLNMVMNNKVFGSIHKIIKAGSQHLIDVLENNPLSSLTLWSLPYLYFNASGSAK